MKLSSKSAGFTLVEIMIVVSIIGLLASIAFPGFAQARTGSRRNTCINNLRQIEAAKEQYALANNKGAETTPDPTDIVPYLRGSSMPICPGGGEYTIAAIGTRCSCNLSAAPNLHVYP